MIKIKNFESSDSDDSDFTVNAQCESSDGSLQSDCESIAVTTADTKHGNQNKKKEERKSSQKISNKWRKPRRNSSTSDKEFYLTDKHIIDTSNDKQISVNEKARADSLWENFLSNTGTSPDQQLSNDKNNIPASTSKADLVPQKKSFFQKNNILYTKTTVDLEVTNKDEKCTARLHHTKQNIESKKPNISNILQNIRKKPKLSTLEKSKFDWNQFKEENNLADEISNHNRGKNGYLEKQDFLQRTDSRQFEIEKKLRDVRKRKMN